MGLAEAENFVKIPDEIDHFLSQVSINWIRHRQSNAQINPILGARTLDQLKIIWVF